MTTGPGFLFRWTFMAGCYSYLWLLIVRWIAIALDLTGAESQCLALASFVGNTDYH